MVEVPEAGCGLLLCAVHGCMWPKSLGWGRNRPWAGHAQPNVHTTHNKCSCARHMGMSGQDRATDGLLGQRQVAATDGLLGQRQVAATDGLLGQRQVAATDEQVLRISKEEWDHSCQLSFVLFLDFVKYV